MNHRVVGGGVIACSAIIAYGWVQSALPQGVNECAGEWIGNLSSTFTGQATEKNQRRCSYGALVTSIAAPERIRSNAQFSDRLSNSRLDKLPNSVEQVYSQLLEQAHTAANRDRLAEAIASAASIPKNSRHYDVAQRLQEDWSQELLQRASNCYQQADLTMAVTMLSAIPQTSQRHDRAVDLHQRWSQQAVLLNQALAAREAENWHGAMNALKALEGTQLYQSAPVQELLQQATNRSLTPNETLLQLASANAATDATVVSALPSNASYSTPLAVDLPQRSNLTIGIDQALEWVRPTTASNLTLPSKSPKQDNASVNPFADSSPMKSSAPAAR